MPATASLPITPVLGQLRDLIGGGESGSAPQQAVDGKTLCGSGSPTPEGGDPAQRHLLAAFDYTHGVVPGQVDVHAKTNEVPMLPTLLDGLDLAAVVVTVDALHTVQPNRWIKA